MLSVFESTGILVPFKDSVITQMQFRRYKRHLITWEQLQRNDIPERTLALLCGDSDNWNSASFTPTPIIALDKDDCSLYQACVAFEKAFPKVQYHARMSIRNNGVHIYTRLDNDLPDDRVWKAAVKSCHKEINGDPQCGARVRFELKERSWHSSGSKALTLTEEQLTPAPLTLGDMTILEGEAGEELENWVTFFVNKVNQYCTGCFAEIGNNLVVYLTTDKERTPRGFYVTPCMSKGIYKQGLQGSPEQAGGLSWEHDSLKHSFSEDDLFVIRKTLNIMSKAYKTNKTCNPPLLNAFLTALEMHRSETAV